MSKWMKSETELQGSTYFQFGSGRFRGTVLFPSRGERSHRVLSIRTLGVASSPALWLSTQVLCLVKPPSLCSQHLQAGCYFQALKWGNRVRQQKHSCNYEVPASEAEMLALKGCKLKWLSCTCRLMPGRPGWSPLPAPPPPAMCISLEEYWVDSAPMSMWGLSGQVLPARAVSDTGASR